MTAVGAESPQESAAAEAELGAFRVVVVAVGTGHVRALWGRKSHGNEVRWSPGFTIDDHMTVS